MIDITDLLMIAVAIMLIVIALLLACALRIVCRGAARALSPAAVADDPFFFPFGDMPTIPRERLLVARDFRDGAFLNWIPRVPSGGTRAAAVLHAGRGRPSFSAFRK